MSPANQTRRSVMLVAWGFHRSEATRSFSDCLRAAWKWVRGMVTMAKATIRKAKAQGGKLRLSADLTRSPIRRSLNATAHGGQKAYRAAYHTAWLGR